MQTGTPSRPCLFRVILGITSMFLALAQASASVIAGPIVNPANSHIYYLLDATSWTNSEAEAVSMGGHLATIRSNAENNWVFDTFQPRIPSSTGLLWIGLNDIQTEGQFRWASGEDVTFTTWSQNQPDNAENEEDWVCVWTHTIGPWEARKWNDAPDDGHGMSGIPYAVVEVAAPALTLHSRNPSSGVMLGVTLDLNGLGQGVTPFVRTYNWDTHVSISVGSGLLAGNKVFDHFEKDGGPLVPPLIMDGPHEVTAVYVQAYYLSVQSSGPSAGVPMTVWTADYFNRKNGSTAFSRLYKAGTVASVTAPANLANQWFDHWEKDGAAVPGGNRTITVTLGAAHTIRAAYLTGRTLTVGSLDPNSGVPITVWRADKNGLQNGTTQFVRTYTQGTQVALSAPAVVGGVQYFKRWDLDGAPWKADRTVTVPMFANRTLTAVYGTGLVLTVQSSEPTVPISVWNVDRNGLSSGTTTFTRLYPPAASVSLTAPATTNGKHFIRWMKDNIAVPGTSMTVTVAMDTAHTLRAEYGH